MEPSKRRNLPCERVDLVGALKASESELLKVILVVKCCWWVRVLPLPIPSRVISP